MNSLAYEIEGRELSGQQVSKTEGLIAGQFDDTSDEDASLFEIHDSEEDLEEVAPEACSLMSEPQVPSLQVNGQLIDDNYQGYKEEDDEGDFLFEGMEKHSSSDDGFTNEDNTASMGHLVKEDDVDSYIDRRKSKTFCSLQVPLKAYVTLSEAGKETYNRQEDLIFYGGSKRREALLEMVGTNLGRIFQNPEPTESLQSHIVNEVPSSVRIDESEQCDFEVRPEEENQEACEVSCSSPVYPCLRSKDSKLIMMEMEIKDRSHEPFLSVAEPVDGSHAAAEGLSLHAQTLKACANEDVNKKLLPFSQEDERISSVDMKPSIQDAQDAAAIGNKNKDLESCTHESSLSCGVQQETSSSRATDRLCPPDKLLIHKDFEVGPMRVTRSMSMGKLHLKRTGDVRLDRSGFGIPVGKRTGKRTAARGVRSVWGTGMGLLSLNGGIDVVQPCVSLKKKLAGKDNLGHVKLSLGPVWMQRKGRGKGKSPVSGKTRGVQEHICHDSTDDNMLEGESITPAKNSEDVQISRGSMAGQSMTGLRKKLSKKMQAVGTVDSMKPSVSRARKRSNCRNKSNSGKGQNDGEVRLDSKDFINDLVSPTYVDSKLETDCELAVHKIPSTETGSVVLADMVPEVFCQNRVTSKAAVIEGRAIEGFTFGCVGSRISSDFAGFQKILGQTLQFQENMENGSQVLGNRNNANVSGKIMDSLASNELTTETLHDVGKQIEEKCEIQEPASRVESQLITRIEGYGEAVGMHVREEEGLVLLFDKGRGGVDEQRSPQRDQFCSKHYTSIQFVDEQADIDSLQGFVSTEAVPDGKGPEKSVLTGDMVGFEQHRLQTNGGIKSSWQSKCLKLPTSENLEDIYEDSFRDMSIANSIGSEKGRKCVQFGEDAGSATSPGGVAKVGTDCLQPEIKSQMRGRGSKKGKAKGGITLVSTGDLKTKHCAQDSVNARKKGEPSRSKKTNSKQIHSFQGGEACVQSRCELDKKVAGHRKKSNKGVVMQVCLENTEKNKLQMELQVQKKRKRHCKGIAVGLDLIEAAGSCEFNKKAGKSRKNIVGGNKVASNVLKRNPLGSRRKEVTETSKTNISGVVTMETDTSTLVKKQMNFSKSQKGGKEKMASLLEAKIVEKDTHHLRTVAGTDIGSYERCKTNSSKFLPHMGDQTSEGTLTTLKDSKQGEVQTVCESMVAERYCFTDMGDVESSVVAKKAREGEFSGDLATIGLGHHLDSYSGFEKTSHRLLGTGESNLTTIGEDVCSGVTEGECPDHGVNVSANVEESAGTKAGSAGVGWVMCDDCRKWRCISTELADIIEATDARW
ncbi:hypothetical protein O6H91_05G110700 [Diphasiastrum complanatum]|nr:hypothetical protein O6H91_05G110700 [Diphasiastrum complanatum]